MKSFSKVKIWESETEDSPNINDTEKPLDMKTRIENIAKMFEERGFKRLKKYLWNDKDSVLLMDPKTERYTYFGTYLNPFSIDSKRNGEYLWTDDTIDEFVEIKIYPVYRHNGTKEDVSIGIDVIERHGNISIFKSKWKSELKNPKLVQIVKDEAPFNYLEEEEPLSVQNFSSGERVAKLSPKAGKRSIENAVNKAIELAKRFQPKDWSSFEKDPKDYHKDTTEIYHGKSMFMNEHIISNKSKQSILKESHKGRNHMKKTISFNQLKNILTEAVRNTWHGVPEAKIVYRGRDSKVVYNREFLDIEDLDDFAWNAYEQECIDNGKEPNEDAFENLPTSWFKKAIDDYMTYVWNEHYIYEKRRASKKFKKSFVKESSDKRTYSIRELKNLVQLGKATDITDYSFEDGDELWNRGYDVIGLSRGIYGLNGALLKMSDTGELMAILKRNSLLSKLV